MRETNEQGYPNFEELSAEEGLDIASIFGESTQKADENPFETAVPQETPAAPKEPAKEQKEAATPAAPQKTEEPEENPLAAAFAQTAAENTQMGLFEKAPIFSYGNAKETIEDTSMTFEELRIKKADDFPELEDGKTVSWVVKYGDTRKTVSDPKGTTIAKIKEEIEKSKAFLDSLKKGKSKNPECLVTPQVTAKSKGISAYKGVFADVEAARASDKVICLIPARNGRVYELRKTEMGEFIAPKNNIVDFSEVRAGFSPALPRVPEELMGQIISFFRSLMRGGKEYEALAYLYWDRENEEFVAFVPKQQAGKDYVHTTLTENCLPEERYLHYADIHSHNSMPARFSPVDNHDERATRLYIVLGNLERFYPSITVRASCGGEYVELAPNLVLEGIGEEFPAEWLDQVELGKYDCDERTIDKFLYGGFPEKQVEE